jgi:hypothetical protein
MSGLFCQSRGCPRRRRRRRRHCRACTKRPIRLLLLPLVVRTAHFNQLRERHLRAGLHDKESVAFGRSSVHIAPIGVRPRANQRRHKQAL